MLTSAMKSPSHSSVQNQNSELGNCPRPLLLSTFPFAGQTELTLPDGV